MTPVLYPSAGRGVYFKREMTDDQMNSDEEGILTPISFSIPENKIRKKFTSKNKMYPSQVQLEEAYEINKIRKNSTKKHVFKKEKNYYKDIAKSKYGITQKKGEWECMRHYEIAANMTVPCFYKLSSKPFMSAPHGLMDMYNCISFNSAKQLKKKR